MTTRTLRPDELADIDEVLDAYPLPLLPGMKRFGRWFLRRVAERHAR